MMSRAQTVIPPLASALPPARPPIVGLLVGAATAGALAFLAGDRLGRFSSPLMLLCHGLSAAALASLALEAFRLRAWAGVLGRVASEPDLSAAEGWPATARLIADYRVPWRHDRGDVLAAIRDVGAALHARLAWRWGWYQLLGFALPALGLIDGWWNLRRDTAALPWGDLFAPLAGAWIEGLAVVGSACLLDVAAGRTLQTWREVSSAAASSAASRIDSEPIDQDEPGDQDGQADDGDDWRRREALDDLFSTLGDQSAADDQSAGGW